MPPLGSTLPERPDPCYGVDLVFLLEFAEVQKARGFGHWRLETRRGAQAVKDLCERTNCSREAAERAVTSFVYGEGGIAFKEGAIHCTRKEKL